jgi:hypothetical protein
MTDVTVERGNGLTYFNPQYVGALRDVFEETEQEVLKTFSKSVTVSTPRGNNPANAIERTFTITFDYMSMTVTTSSKFNYIVRRGANSLVSQPFNISGDFGRVSFRPDRILTDSETRARLIEYKDLPCFRILGPTRRKEDSQAQDQTWSRNPRGPASGLLGPFRPELCGRRSSVCRLR